MDKINTTKKCIDAMIWVGNKSHQWQTIDEFIKEAQLRGCCRHIPSVYGWMEFGKTKIFLAGKGKHKEESRGSLFGYFTLNRIEIITESKIAQSLPGKKKGGYVWPCDIKQYIKYIKELKKEGHSDRIIKDLLTEKLQIDYIPKFSRDEICKKPSRRRIKIKSRQKGEYGEENGFLDLIEKILKFINEKWLKEKKVKNKSFLVCFSSAIGEGERGCSIRTKIGSVYVVDALCAAIHDKNRQLLTEYLEAGKKLGKTEQEILDKIKKENKALWSEWFWKRKIDKWSIEELINTYSEPFRIAVKTTYKKWDLMHTVDSRIKDKVNIYGELVVFKKPYPILERIPQAAFRGICRINGDELINQISKHTGEKALIPTIYYCNGGGKIDMKKISTKKELSLLLTQKLNLNIACANRVISLFSSEAISQLKQYNKFKLPGIGTLSLKKTKNGKKIRFSPNKLISTLAK
jgi:nucleoid DNA-binding protein